MADVSLHGLLSQSRDARYIRQVAERADVRDFARETQNRQDQATERSREAQDAQDAAVAERQRARDAEDNLRRLDTEQRLRDVQSDRDLKAFEQARLDAIAAARDEGQAVPRGYYLDVVA